MGEGAGEGERGEQMFLLALCLIRKYWGQAKCPPFEEGFSHLDALQLMRTDRSLCTDRDGAPPCSVKKEAAQQYTWSELVYVGKNKVYDSVKIRTRSLGSNTQLT